MKDLRDQSPTRRFVTDLAILLGMEIAIGAALGAVICGAVYRVKLFL